MGFETLNEGRFFKENRIAVPGRTISFRGDDRMFPGNKLEESELTPIPQEFYEEGQVYGLLWNPGQIETEGWYDASDLYSIEHLNSYVTRFKDKSGKGRHFTQDVEDWRPRTEVRTQNGLNVLDFNGNNSMLSTHGTDSLFASNKDIYLFTVSSIDEYDDDYADILTFKDGVAGYQNDRPYRGFGFATATFLEGCHSIFEEGGDSEFRSLLQDGKANDNQYSINFCEQQVIPIGDYVMLMSRFNRSESGNPVESRVNGGDVGNFNLTSVNEEDRTAKAMILCGCGNSTLDRQTVWMNGAIGEVVMAHGLSGLNRHRIEGYLAWKWGIAAGLPSDHPYKDAAPRYLPY